jgi:hypothetical protein
MKKLLFGMAALVVAGAIVTLEAAPTRDSKWVLSSSVYELDGVLYADGFSGGSTSLELTSGKMLIGVGGLAADVTLLTKETAAAGASLVLYEGTNNGVHTLTLQCPASLAASRAVTFPDAAVDLGVIVAGGTLPAVNGAAVTSLDGGNIASGDIESARLTMYGVVVSDFTGDGDFLVGTGVGTFAAESGATARTSLGLTIGTDVLAPDGDGTSLTGVALDTEVWAAPTASEATNDLENVVTIQAKNLAAGDLEERRLIRVWVSETDYGTASTNNIASLVLSTGVAVDTVTANADYRYVTASDGSAIATITATAAGTHYIMCVDGSSISSTEITFTSP